MYTWSHYVVYTLHCSNQQSVEVTKLVIIVVILRCLGTREEEDV